MILAACRTENDLILLPLPSDYCAYVLTSSPLHPSFRLDWVRWPSRFHYDPRL